MAEAAPRKHQNMRYDITLFTAQPLLLNNKSAAGEVDVDGFKAHFQKTLVKIGKKVSCVHKFATTTNFTKVGIEGTQIVHLLLHGSKIPNFLTIENTARVGFAQSYPPETLEPILATLSSCKLFFVYSKHADITCDLLSKLGVEYVVGFQYLYGGEDPAGRDFQDEFYQLILNSSSIEKSFTLARKRILEKYTSDTKLKDRIFFKAVAGASADVPLFNLERGTPDWNNLPSPHFFPAPESDKPVVGFNEAISKVLDSIQNGISITWIQGLKGSGKTTLALQVCKYLSERDYVDDKPLPIIYCPLQMYDKIRNKERTIREDCKLQDHLTGSVSGPGLSHEVGKILHYLGKKQKKFCHTLARTRYMIKQKLIEIEQQEGRIERLQRRKQNTTEALAKLQTLGHEYDKYVEEKERLREFSQTIDFALSPFAGIRGAQLYKSLGKKYKYPWLLVIDGLNEVRFNGGTASKTVLSFLKGLINNNQHCRIMICTNLKFTGKLPLNYISQTSLTIPLFRLPTKIDLFLNHRPESLTRMEFGDISREQLVGYVKRSAIVKNLLPNIDVAQGVIDLAAELKDSMVSCVSRMVMNSLVLIKNRYAKLEATGALPDLIYIDDYQRSLITNKWTVWARPCERPASIPKIGLKTPKRKFDPVSIGVLPHYDTAYSRDKKETGKIGELDIDDKFEEDIISIVLDGILQYDELHIRSPFGVTYHIERTPKYYGGEPIELKVIETDTPDENIFYRENNEFGMYWEANILPTLPLELRTKALEFRSKTGDGLDGDKEADGTLPMNACMDWSASEVAIFIKSIASLPEYEVYAQTFEDNGVSGEFLETMDEPTLEELGVTSKLHRKVILQRTRQLLDS